MAQTGWNPIDAMPQAKSTPCSSAMARICALNALAAVDALAKAAKLEPKDSGVAADFCRALVEKDMRAKAAEEACRRAVGLDAQNGLGHYELVKILVARGDCAGATAEVGKLGTMEATKGKAKTQAEEILKTCVPGKVAKPSAEATGGGKPGKK